MDWLAIGSGAAGMASAVRAADLGLDALIVEATEGLIDVTAARAPLTSSGAAREKCTRRAKDQSPRMARS